MDKCEKNCAAVLPTHTPALFHQACEAAAALLRRGELVALPTETVYGLAANALDAAAVGRIYEAKGRPKHNPIIIHVEGVTMARTCVAKWTAEADLLAEAFWPGPLTMVLPRGGGVPDIVTAGGNNVGVRWPSHPIMREVIHLCGFPLAAPSANPANRVSPTTAQHVRSELGARIPLIVDGGPCQVGIESTVLDISSTPAVLLRPGMIDIEDLRRILPVEMVSGPGHQQLRSPGLLPKHYSPKARLVLAEWTTEAELVGIISGLRVDLAKCQVIAFDHVPQSLPPDQVAVVPADPEAYARALYAELHRCDANKAELIIVEEPPQGIAWQGIRDRLKRASA